MMTSFVTASNPFVHGNAMTAAAAAAVVASSSDSSPANSSSPERSAAGVDWLQCAVCCRPYSEPWLLRCLHTVCAECYDARADDARPECPVCLERDVFGHMKVRPDFAARALLQRLAAAGGAGGGAVGPPLCSSLSTPSGAECQRPAILYCVTCTRRLCSVCCGGHGAECRDQRMHSAGQAAVEEAEATAAAAAAAAGDGGAAAATSSCWLHADQPLRHYCAVCEVPACAQCLDSHHHPAEQHRVVPLEDDYVLDELALLCERVQSQMRRVLDMKKVLVRQVRRQCEAHERCRRLLHEHHELLVDVLVPAERQLLLRQLDDAHRLAKARLEPFVERALALGADVSHVVAVVERQLQFAGDAHVLALKKPVEARLAALNRKLDEHFSSEQPVAQLLMRSAPDMARDLLRVLYRSGPATAVPAAVNNQMRGGGVCRGSPVPPPPQQQQPPVSIYCGLQAAAAAGAQPLAQLCETGCVEMGALNEFGSSTTASASDSSHGSSPELSLSHESARCQPFERQQPLSQQHQHYQQQQQQQQHYQQQQLQQQSVGYALPSDLSALINDNGVGCDSGFVRPYGGQSVSSGGSSGCSSGGGSRLHALSHITTGVEHSLTLDAGGGSYLDTSSALGGPAGGGARLRHGQALPPLTTTSPVPIGGGGGGGGLGHSILTGACGVAERTFNTSFDSGFSGRFSPYSTAAATGYYGRWSNGTDCSLLTTAGGADGALQARPGSGQRGLDSSTPTLPGAAPVAVTGGGATGPARSHVRRQKMIYNVKLGEFGVMEGQFTEPSGVAVNARNEIIVADTNNHRIQVFDKEGRFQFSFGECGKREGQLLYPNRVFVNRQSGDIVVTERSPTHQIQIYNQYGAFMRKFGADILQHPRGVTVDTKNRIIVVECKVMRVLIFDYAGEVVKRFGCSRHLEFPNGVAVNEKEEIFISDNRAHCVKVFNYDGLFLRKIGGEGVTNYPIGVGINQLGQVVIADNHNNFNLTVFSQDGQIISALESKVKHAQCFDMALMDGGSVVLASKDYRLYVYRYAPVQGQTAAAAAVATSNSAAAAAAALQQYTVAYPY